MMYKKNIIIKTVAVSIVFLFLISGLSALTYGTQASNKPTYNSLENIIPNKIPRTLLNKTNNNNQPVNPFSLYSKEPAPMGIADYGIGPNNQPYAYETPEFLGVINVNKLETYNASLNQSAYWMTFQLNVNLVFENGNTQYAYWIQDVVFVNTSDNYIQFIDNIWNFSSPGANMFDSTVLGNGTVGNSSGTGFYYDWANQYLPGNDISLSYPYNIQLEVFSYINAQGYPAVAFQYNDGYGWVTYDNANFVFASDLTSYPEFLVDGYQYEPTGYTFYDAELILGGPGGGAQTYDVSSSLTLQLEYWNGHNFQMIDNAYNFGSNTAEGISNVVSSAMYYRENGSIFESILNGSGQLSPVYNQSDIGIVNISSSLSSGYLMVNNTKYNFIDGDVNITIAPGKYLFSLYSSSGLLIKEWNEVIYAGGYLPLSTLNIYQITFTEKGLPPGTVWYVNLSNSQSFSSTTDAIAFTEPNGSYTYTIATLNKEYTPLEFTGSFTVNGSNVNVSVTFHLVTYKMTFIESGLPSGYWYVNITGQPSSGPIPSSQSSYSVSLPNGSYSYTVSTDNNEYKPSYTGSFTVNGASVSQSISFSEVTYTVTFTETGLPSGATWNVTLNGAESSSSTSSISFSEPNGTYSYIIGIYQGYSASPYSGSVTVSGANVNVAITFTQVKYSVTFTESGLPTGISWSVTLNGNTKTSTTSIISFTEPNGTYSFSIASINDYSVSPSSGSITVNGFNMNLAITFTLVTYTVTFTESGLPSGTSWSVTLNEITKSSTTNTITFSIPNGTYSYSIGSVNGYTTSPSSGTITVNGANVNIAVTFTPVYTITFTENGLPTGTLWYVNLSNGQSFSSTTNTITFTEPNGSYSYTIETPISGGTGIQYVLSQSTGTLTVNGADININVPYTTQYYLTIIASPSNGGTVSPSSGWYDAGSSVTIDAISNSNFEFVSWSGTGNGSYSGTNNPVSITINGPITETANFIELYKITFMETGLPSGTMWYVNLSNGQSYNTTGNSIEIQIPNGSYSYMIATTNKEYSAQGGSLIVNGANLEISIKFNLVTYAITFTESGLSSGTSWSVTLNNIEKSSTNGTIIFNEPNGSYSYTISGISGYRANTYLGTINVNGNSIIVPINWTVITYAITITENGIPNGTLWSATLTGTTFNGQYINVTLSSTTNTITFNEPNGTYSYIIHLPSGYQSNNGKGQVNVSGNSAIATIKAQQIIKPQQTTKYLWIGIIAVVIVIAILLAVAFLIRNRNKKRITK